MSTEFNAYSTWLGIPEDEQPPHYYRLLGLEPFESDPDVIRQAGQRVVNLVKAREKGSLGAAARRLKAEVTFAAACLLDEKKKAQYDQELDAWFNEFDSGSSDEYEVEEPDLPMAKIVTRGKTNSKSKTGSGKSKTGSSVRTSGSKSGSSKSKSSKVETRKASKKPLSVGLIVGLAAAVLVVIGLGGALAYVFLKSDKPVAKAEVKPKQPEFDPDDEDETDTKKPAKVDSEETPAGDEKTEAAVDPDKEKKADATPEGEKTAVGPAVETTPAEPPKSDPAKTETPAGETPGEKPAGTPMATGETPAPMPTPTTEPEKTEPVKTETPADPKLEDPFREVELALELPALVDPQASTTPVVIAKVYPKENEPVNAKLNGGNLVLPKHGEFTMTGGGLGVPEPKWTINFVDKQGKSTPIANLSYKTNEFTFAWTGEGDVEKNNVLRNCILQITVGYGNRRLALRKPVEIEPLSVSMEQKGASMPIELSGVPDEPEAVVLEFTKLVGGFPNDATYDPGPQIHPGDKFSIMFSKTDLAFQGTFSEERGGGGFKLDLRPMLRGEKRGNGPRPLKAFIIKPSIEQQIAYVQTLLTNGTTNYEAFKKQNAGNKDLLDTAELKFQEATKAFNDQIKQLGEFKTTVEALSKEGKVQFRIFMRVGDVAEGYTVELVTTKDYSPPEPEKKEEAKKAPAKKKK